MIIYVQRDEGAPQPFELPETLNGEDWGGVSLISAFAYIQQHIDPSFAYAVSCGRGSCNVCLIRIDGHVVTACTTPVVEGMVIKPARETLRLRDLVVEVSLVRKARVQ
jgi:succinate dehydrogenase/fumarate reductase-like Fe-S protein